MNFEFFAKENESKTKTNKNYYIIWSDRTYIYDYITAEEYFYFSQKNLKFFFFEKIFSSFLYFFVIVAFVVGVVGDGFGAPFSCVCFEDDAAFENDRGGCCVEGSILRGFKTSLHFLQNDETTLGPNSGFGFLI